MEVNKPTFSEIYEQHNIEMDTVAIAAKVHPNIVDRMLLGHPVPLGTAEKVLRALSSLTDTKYSLDNTAVTLQQANMSMVARMKEQIADEYSSAMQAMHGFAQTGRHQFITKKMEDMGKQVDDLGELIGHQEAIQWCVNMMDRAESGTVQPNA